MDIERDLEHPPSAGLSPSRSMRARFLREVAGAGIPGGPAPSRPVTEADLEPLPAAAQRYLRFMGVVGRRRTWSFRARWAGDFRMRPDRPWLPCEAWQYNSRLAITRIFHMRMRFAGLFPVLVRDTYVHGKGRMLGRLFDAFRVVDVADDKIDTGELVTYLNDAILLAPTMVLGPETVFTAVDDGSFDVALTDGARTVRGRVLVDESGAVTNFSTTDRYGEDPAHPGEMVRTRWSTPVSGWTTRDGRPVVERASAVWHFPSGDLAYARFSLTRDAFETDVPPGGALAS